jgi:hypothetical protein
MSVLKISSVGLCLNKQSQQYSWFYVNGSNLTGSCSVTINDPSNTWQVTTWLKGTLLLARAECTGVKKRSGEGDTGDVTVTVTDANSNQTDNTTVPVFSISDPGSGSTTPTF